MNYLKYDLTIVNNHIIYLKRDFNYQFLSSLESILEIDIIYNYLLSIDEYKLKNIWNQIVKKWNHMESQLKTNKKYKNSIYYQNDIHYIHSRMSDNSLNDKLSSFINNDQCKSLFVINIILSLIV